MNPSQALAISILPFTIAACGLPNDANYLSDPFGPRTALVHTLAPPELTDALQTLLIRFHAYATLREQLPLATLLDGTCATTVTDSRDAFAVRISAACLSPGATGTVLARQEEVNAADDPIYRFQFTYENVVFAGFTVDGTERITETDAPDGASVRELDLSQDDRPYAYTFRAGFPNGGEDAAFDYTLDLPGGAITARLTTATTAGGLVTITLEGSDGTLRCDIRNSLWSPERLPRGTCDNGVVFGLPAP